MERLADLVAEEDIFNPPSTWLVDEIAETLMTFLASNTVLSIPVQNPIVEETNVGELNVTDHPVQVRHADALDRAGDHQQLLRHSRSGSRGLGRGSRRLGKGGRGLIALGAGVSWKNTGAQM